MNSEYFGDGEDWCIVEQNHKRYLIKAVDCDSEWSYSAYLLDNKDCAHYLTGVKSRVRFKIHEIADVLLDDEL